MGKDLVLLVGPQGSGKTTLATKNFSAYFHINQDLQGKSGHFDLFLDAIHHGRSVIIDRINHKKEQRSKYIDHARAYGYKTTIIVLYRSFDLCLKSCISRENHPTIKDSATASKALNMFFKEFEFVDSSEADIVLHYKDPNYGIKRNAIICDLDGTMCNIDHRIEFVREKGKKDWKRFFEGIPKDLINPWCKSIVNKYYNSGDYQVLLVSGRPDTYKEVTEAWLKENGVFYDRLMMRGRGDFRSDDLVKRIIYKFNIEPYYNIFFCIDDRKRVVDMWRSEGIVCLQCAEGEF